MQTSLTQSRRDRGGMTASEVAQSEVARRTNSEAHPLSYPPHRLNLCVLCGLFGLEDFPHAHRQPFESFVLTVVKRIQSTAKTSKDAKSTAVKTALATRLL